jgi:uncharacterized protein YndB with AHSA1/START domain
MSSSAVARMSVTIGRPVEDVFAVLTDPALTPRWSAPAVEEAWITPPPHGVGSRRRAVVRGFGRRSENVTELTAIEPNRSWQMTSVSGPRFVAEARFEPVDRGTRVELTYAFDFGRATRLVGPVVSRMFTAQFDRDLARLKTLMESGRL